jgi:glycosyltransferase involved in cell wall biosynthesis
MANNPKVTVVIPTKNCSNSVGRLLDSLLKQSYQDFEVLVVDSSNDTTSEIASRYAVRVVECRTNGLTIARNVGVKSSSGEIICFVDGDCTMEPDWLDRIVAEFKKNPQIGCVGGSVLSNESSFIGRYYSEAFIPIYPKYSKPSLIVGQLADQPFSEARFPAGCNMAFKKDALTKVGGFNENWKNAWDEFEVMNRLLQAGYSISVNPKIIVYHSPRSSIFGTIRQAYSYGYGAGTFAKTHKGTLTARVGAACQAAFKSFLHAVNIFKNNREFLPLAYPFLDCVLGLSYYAGYANAYVRDWQAKL